MRGKRFAGRVLIGCICSTKETEYSTIAGSIFGCCYALWGAHQTGFTISHQDSSR